MKRENSVDNLVLRFEPDPNSVHCEKEKKLGALYNGFNGAKIRSMGKVMGMLFLVYIFRISEVVIQV